MVTFGVEMNGDRFPWSGVFQGGSVTDGYGIQKRQKTRKDMLMLFAILSHCLEIEAWIMLYGIFM